MAKTVKKQTIQKTNRIRLKYATIYCSSTVAREVREYVTRLNQVMVPLKGSYDDLIAALERQIKIRPTHFPESSRLIIQSGGHNHD